MLPCVTKRISAAKPVEKEVIKLVYKADNKKRSSTKIGLGGESSSKDAIRRNETFLSVGRVFEEG